MFCHSPNNSRKLLDWKTQKKKTENRVKRKWFHFLPLLLLFRHWRYIIWSFPLCIWKITTWIYFDMLLVKWMALWRTCLHIPILAGQSVHYYPQSTLNDTASSSVLQSLAIWRICVKQHVMSCRSCLLYSFSRFLLFDGFFVVVFIFKTPGVRVRVHKFVSCLFAWLQFSTVCAFIYLFVVFIELNSIFGCGTHHAHKSMPKATRAQNKNKKLNMITSCILL